MSRIKKRKQVVRDRQFNFRVSDEEFAALNEMADNLGYISRGELIREILFSSDVAEAITLTLEEHDE